MPASNLALADIAARPVARHVSCAGGNQRPLVLMIVTLMKCIFVAARDLVTREEA